MPNWPCLTRSSAISVYPYALSDGRTAHNPRAPTAWPLPLHPSISLRYSSRDPQRTLFINTHPIAKNKWLSTKKSHHSHMLRLVIPPVIHHHHSGLRRGLPLRGSSRHLQQNGQSIHPQNRNEPLYASIMHCTTQQSLQPVTGTELSRCRSSRPSTKKAEAPLSQPSS
jgi:hypothetical protein